MDTDRGQQPALDDVGERIATIERIRAHAADVRRRFEALHAEVEPLEPTPHAVAPATEPVVARSLDEHHPDANGEPRADALERQLRELEARRRDEVADLQRAQESLANTQVELIRTTKELRAAEERVRALEAAMVAAGIDPSGALDGDEAPTARRPAGIVTRGEDEVAPSRSSTEETSSTVRSSWTHLPGAPVPGADDHVEDTEDVAGASPVDLAPSDGTDPASTLRDRLARAAGARHRVTGI
jgi:hypothetical protein